MVTTGLDSILRTENYCKFCAEEDGVGECGYSCYLYDFHDWDCEDVYNILKQFLNRRKKEMLLDEELLKVVPKIGDTDNMDLKDVKIHAFFEVAGSNWLWMLTEYDSEFNAGFGVVRGNYTELGSFSISDLERLGAKRCFRNKEGKTFKELEAFLGAFLSNDFYELVYGGK